MLWGFRRGVSSVLRSFARLQPCAAARNPFLPHTVFLRVTSPPDCQRTLGQMGCRVLVRRRQTLGKDPSWWRAVPHCLLTRGQWRGGRRVGGPRLGSVLGLTHSILGKRALTSKMHTDVPSPSVSRKILTVLPHLHMKILWRSFKKNIPSKGSNPKSSIFQIFPALPHAHVLVHLAYFFSAPLCLVQTGYLCPPPPQVVC